MKTLQINAVSGQGSTGKICESISELLCAEGIDNKILFASHKTHYPYSVKYAGDKYIKVQALKSRVLGNYGFNSHLATYKLISEIQKFAPDIIHLHNLHGHNANLPILFGFLKKNNIKTIWTFHDCWAFTAYCSHFTLVKCEQWKKRCKHCPQLKGVSWFFDKSTHIYNKKKELFSGLNLTIVTPSEWLAGLVEQSFLKDYPVKVINNGIDLNVFKPTESDFRKKYNIPEEKFILLGVAFGWGKRKGLDVFIDLQKRLDNAKYQIVLVGTDDNVDKQLPSGIISIHRTQNQTELAEIYTAADLFVNPTREENYPTVNMESIACGTPMITFKTGGSPEILTSKTGTVVECDDVDSLEKEICRIYKDRPYTKEDCVSYAKKFDMKDRFQEYIKLYQEL